MVKPPDKNGFTSLFAANAAGLILPCLSLVSLFKSYSSDD
uniref:Uncharacterized protein n=1 Tax=Anguilla anguilla TaxID=7936 RepID=A0A0E9V9V5_ANGAN